MMQDRPVERKVLNTETGTFSLVDLSQDIVDRRSQVLERREWVRRPAGLVEMNAAGLGRVSTSESIRQHLLSAGVVVIKNENPIGITQLLDIASSLGALIEDDSPPEFRAGRYVANIRQDLPASSDAAVQPFAENYITFHTEHSYKPVEQQPRWLIFSCLNAPVRDCGGQTLLRSSKSVVEALSRKSREILSAVSYPITDQFGEIATFVRAHHGEQSICFRDYDLAGTPWMYPRALGGCKAEIHEAISELFAAIYKPAEVFGIHWQRGDVWIIDNFRFLHGKTFYPADASASTRWLQRAMVKEDRK